MADTATDNSNSTSATTTDTGTTEATKGGNSKTFTQEEVDAMLAARVKREAAKYDELTKKAVADALADQERKSKLTEEQRAKEELAAKTNALEEREHAIILRENKAEASVQLSKIGLDPELALLIVDVDMGKTKENIKVLEKAFNASADATIKKRLAGRTPTDFGDGSKDKSTSKNKSDLSSGRYRAAGAVAF